MVDVLTHLRQAHTEDRLTPLELATAHWSQRHGASDPVALAMALTVRAVADGHSCLVLPEDGPALPGEPPYCSAEDLLLALRDSPLVGESGSNTPLILDGNRLYQQRYWRYENRLAERLRSLLARPPEPVDTHRLGPDGGLFDYGWVSPGEPNWQAVAAATALRHRFAVISGGPGTGKTYTVLRLIRLVSFAIMGRSIMEASSTITTSAASGLSRS